MLQGRTAIAKLKLGLLIYPGFLRATFVHYSLDSCASGALRKTLYILSGQPLAENTAQLWDHD